MKDSGCLRGHSTACFNFSLTSSSPPMSDQDTCRTEHFFAEFRTWSRTTKNIKSKRLCRMCTGSLMNLFLMSHFFKKSSLNKKHKTGLSGVHKGMWHVLPKKAGRSKTCHTSSYMAVNKSETLLHILPACSSSGHHPLPFTSSIQRVKAHLNQIIFCLKTLFQKFAQHKSSFSSGKWVRCGKQAECCWEARYCLYPSWKLVSPLVCPYFLQMPGQGVETTSRQSLKKVIQSAIEVDKKEHLDVVQALLLKTKQPSNQIKFLWDCQLLCRRK